MTGFVRRYLILALLGLSIVLPQASAALAGLGLASGHLVVICTGDGLRSIRINDAGEPVDLAQPAEFCALVDAGDTSDSLSPGMTTPRLLYAAAAVVPASLVPPAHSFSPSLPRGPPAG